MKKSSFPIVLALVLGLSQLSSGFAASARCDRVILGAIRWDAWLGDETREGRAVEKSLGPPKWRDRWPVFQGGTAESFDLDGTKPDTVRSEIDLAVRFGIDYWAFVFYGNASPMSSVLNQYLAANGTKPKFALIVEAGRLTGESGIGYSQDLAGLLGNSNYLRDDAGRPIVYVMVPSTSKPKDLGYVFRRLHDAQRGSPPPSASVVVMSFNPTQAAEVARSLPEPHRISVYAWHGNELKGRYAQLVGYVERLWATQERMGVGVVPIVMAGWDPRPRIDNPMPWGSDYGVGAYYDMPTGAEFEQHVRDALQWKKRRPDGLCSVLVYAWNEFDEGGWIAPTKYDRDGRLDDIERARKSVEPERRSHRR